MNTSCKIISIPCADSARIRNIRGRSSPLTGWRSLPPDGLGEVRHLPDVRPSLDSAPPSAPGMSVPRLRSDTGIHGQEAKPVMRGTGSLGRRSLSFYSLRNICRGKPLSSADGLQPSALPLYISFLVFGLLLRPIGIIAYPTPYPIGQASSIFWSGLHATFPLGEARHHPWFAVTLISG